MHELIFGWAYSWNALGVSNMVGLCARGGGGAYIRGGIYIWLKR